MAVSLKSLEKKIEENAKAAWHENNLIMLKIRNEKLYKKKYGTFEKYLEARWNLGKQRGHRLMNSAEFMQLLEKNPVEKVAQNDKLGDKKEVILPKNERQIRPLLEKLEHNGERIKVWEKVVETGEKINAELVQTKVDEFLESGEVVPDIKYVEDEINIGKKTHVSHNSGVNEWYTPAIYIEAVKKVMGSIDCDPATSEIANETIKAASIFTAEQDGLEQVWGKNIWLNPPYAQPLIGKFCKATVDKFESGEIKQACVLVNNATETKWFQSLLSISSAVCFPVARIKFLDPKGKPGAPLQGQAIIYIGENKELFVSEFKQFGSILLNGI